MTKKILAGLMVLALSLLVVKPVLAQDAIAVDFNGGLFLDENSGFILNDSDSLANSGFNTVGKKATVTTENAYAGSSANTTLNTTSLGGTTTDTQDGPMAYNLDSEGSDLLAVAVDANLIGVLNFNFGMVGNHGLAMANTGFNDAGKKSTITTGIANATTNASTDMNRNWTNVEIIDSGEGSVAANIDVDEKSTATAVAVDANAVLIAELNMGGVCNFSIAGANSGLNTSGEDSTIETTGATASTGTTTGLNSNTNVVSITDSGAAGSVAANIDFDECADPGLAVAVDANAAIVLNGNFGFVGNVSLAGANTGINTNGEDSTIKTGSAVASTATSTTLNTNSTMITITDHSNGPVAVNTDDDTVNPCNPQVPGLCEENPPCGDPCGAGGCTDACQTQTGPVAANVGTDGGTAVAVDANVAVVANVNDGLVMNNSVALANSGLNGAGEDSSVTTGNAVASTGTYNTVNTNSANVTITDNVIADGVLTDGESSGPVAANVDTNGGTAVSVEANAAVVANFNDAVVVNNSTAVANTGDNGTGTPSCAGGCGSADGGSVTTGNATATTTTTNNVNSNTTTFTINH